MKIISAAVDPSTRELCLSLLRDQLKRWQTDFWPSMHAAEALTRARHAHEVDDFLSHLALLVPTDEMRVGVARERARAGRQEYIAAIVDALKQPNNTAHSQAAESLLKLGDVGQGRGVLQAAMSQDAERVQVMAAGALVRADGDADVSANALLRRKLSSRIADIACAAAWVLSWVGRPDDIPLLRANMARFPPTDDNVDNSSGNDKSGGKGISSASARNRAYFEHALAMQGDPGGLAALEKNLGSGDGAVRGYAAEYVLALGIAGRFRSRLADMVARDPVMDTRVRAAQALLLMGV
eukprot:jgi/Mesvir1/6237/Mv00915-RA.1